MKNYCLFIDELGVYNPKDTQSDVYILCGCSIPHDRREEIKILADQIKYKYWNRTDVVFHSREIGRNEGDFAIFKNDPKLKENFYKDLFSYLNKIPVTIFLVVVDKEVARKEGWNGVKIVQETSYRLIFHFIALLLSSKCSKGSVIIESAAAEKDKYYLNAFSYFLSPGFKELWADHTEIKQILTSISFVTKNNFDIEEQIADLFAYVAKCKYRKTKSQAIYSPESYEGRMIKILEQKLFNKPENAKEIKKKVL